MTLDTRRRFTRDPSRVLLKRRSSAKCSPSKAAASNASALVTNLLPRRYRMTHTWLSSFALGRDDRRKMWLHSSGPHRSSLHPHFFLFECFKWLSNASHRMGRRNGERRLRWPCSTSVKETIKKSIKSHRERSREDQKGRDGGINLCAVTGAPDQRSYPALRSHLERGERHMP